WTSSFGSPFRHKATSKIKIVIGKDTRRSGYMIETALASGICSMGGEAILLGPLPTPGVAFVAHSMRADAGVMISASHNPFSDNGIKIFGPDGFKAPDSIEAAIEELIADPRPMDDALPRGERIGRAYRIEEAHGRYIVFLKSKFPNDSDLSGIKIALDCANGAAYKSAPMAFEELGAEVSTVGVSPNGTNINQDIGALHPEKMAALTKRSGAQIGIALDGDADRVVLADENGEVLDGDVVIGLCALEMKERGELRGNGIVTTPMSNIGLEMTLRQNGIQMHRAAVGDRFVVEKMRSEGFCLGGEQSGHLIFLDSSTTGDGALAALKVLEIMKRTGKPLSELKKQILLLPQTLLNLKVKERKALEGLPSYQKALKSAESSLNGKGRIFVRYSGTEPKLRVLVESESEVRNEAIANDLKQALIEDLGT
ncbi:MAG: phosphoglucosamine mutase, partial [Proteobacteria bacterium]|nr:phosphoglucosamine mutase [Pseudomonadota bacterium]